MRIACPSCAAEYEVPASRMTPRRMVRCERCGNEWVAVQETEAAPPATEPVDAAPDDAGPNDASPANASLGNASLGNIGPEQNVASPPVAPANVAIGRLAPSRPARGRDVGLLAAWIASVVLLAGAATALLVWRSDVVRAWPASARLLGSPAVVAVPAHAPGGTAAKKPAPHE